MADARWRRVGVQHIGTARAARGLIHALDGERLLLDRAYSLEVHRRDGFLALGAVRPLSKVELPSVTRGTALPDDGFVLCDEFRVWRAAPDGSTRWELSEEIWPDGDRVRGDVTVSPDGSLAAVVKATRVAGPSPPDARVDDGPEEHPYGPDVLLLLDTATGEVLGRQPLDVPALLTARHVWHPDGSRLAVSCWDFWDSWITYWLGAGRDGLRLLGRKTMVDAAAFVPGSSRLLTVRRAEGFGASRQADELASYDTDTSERLAVEDVGDLLADWGDPSGTQAYLLDAERVILSVNPRDRDRDERSRHWLCDADTLRPLGLLDYSVHPGAGHAVTPLEDGTWLTRRGRRVDRWALA
ncbi:hypothetical protein CW362_17010 [Streptomyces populi]|uniref:Uncharacterized protein n=1 Tax=Streptomyces populi TaxID=2058924 RepID=A0A2I0SPC6_9ACTN|nr:hypothetical protein [Streptomyces populi]PKT71788.1 hypothetical protein CW362_17010 [Streptomyces populi]